MKRVGFQLNTSSIVIEVISTISGLFINFLQKNFERTKTKIKPKPTNKTKTSKQKTKKASFWVQKLLRGEKLFVLHFGAFCALKIFS